MSRTKYNVGRDDEDMLKRTCDGILFDSVLEMRFYREVVKPGVERGEIKHYELQKPYELQEKFQRNGKTIRAITYVADFYIEYSDGRTKVVDTKGCPDTLAKVKRKLFWYKFPETDYVWITYSKKYGGWLEYDEVKNLRHAEKLAKLRELKEKKDNG